MRTVFLGTSDLAAGVLARLAASAHSPALVVSRPDRPKGRGRRLSAPPVAERARELCLPLAQPQSVNAPEAVAEIRRVEPDCVVVCAFGALIREPLLSLWPMLNVHPSLLPRWRGAAPIERAIIAGDATTGVSIMRLTAGLDSGPVCLAQEVEIGEQDDHGTLSQRLCVLGGELLVRALDMFAAGRPPAFAEQDDQRATYAEKIGPEDRVLDPGRPSTELARRVRALHPHIGARLRLGDGSMLGVLRASALPSAGQAAPASQAPGSAAPAPQALGSAAPASQAPGSAAPASPPAEAPPSRGELAARDGRLLLGCAEGTLELLEVQPPGGRAMDARAFLRGHAI